MEKRFSQGLYLLEPFTWSKAIDIAPQVQDGGGNRNNCGNGISSVQNIYHLQANRGISAYNHPLISTTSAVWSLPFPAAFLAAHADNYPRLAHNCLVRQSELWTVNCEPRTVLPPPKKSPISGCETVKAT